MRIGIIGVAGRMGRLLVEEATMADHSALGLLGPHKTADAAPEVPLAESLAALAGDSDVVIDFTVASTADAHASALESLGTPWVLGTSGLSVAQEARVAEAARRIPVAYSANFSPGITLLLQLAERMAAALPPASYDAEIMEMHHRQKVDAPSGTAVALGRAVAKGRGVALEDVTESGRDGHTGARRAGAIGFSAMRGGQVVGEHTLLFAGASEHVALTHRAFDRRVFATGAVRAAAWLVGRAPGLYSMMDVMAADVMGADVMGG